MTSPALLVGRSGAISDAIREQQSSLLPDHLLSIAALDAGVVPPLDGPAQALLHRSVQVQRYYAQWPQVTAPPGNVNPCGTLLLIEVAPAAQRGQQASEATLGSSRGTSEGSSDL